MGATIHNRVFIPGHCSGELLFLGRAAQGGDRRLARLHHLHDLVEVAGSYFALVLGSGIASRLRVELCLFDELSSEHGLTGRDRLLLEVAALLHDIGDTLGMFNHFDIAAAIQQAIDEGMEEKNR